MFGSQALRLLRESWTDLNEFSEEVYAILSNPDIPLDHSGPITLTQQGTEPGIAFKGFDPGDFAISIKRPDEGDIVLGGDGLEFLDPEGKPKPPEKTAQPGETRVFIGIVGAQVPDTTDKYYVDIPYRGLTVQVQQASIDPAEIIPEGTRTIVFIEGSHYKMQVPVWVA